MKVVQICYNKIQLLPKKSTQSETTWEKVLLLAIRYQLQFNINKKLENVEKNTTKQHTIYVCLYTYTSHKCSDILLGTTT